MDFYEQETKWTNKENDKYEAADSLYTLRLDITNLCSKFQNPTCSIFLRNILRKCLLAKKKWTNTVNDKHADTDSLLHDASIVPNVCTKFQNPRCSSA